MIQNQRNDEVEYATDTLEEETISGGKLCQPASETVSVMGQVKSREE